MNTQIVTVIMLIIIIVLTLLKYLNGYQQNNSIPIPIPIGLSNSGLSYCEQDQIKNMIQNETFMGSKVDNIIYNEESNIKLYTATSDQDGSIYIAFRGTLNFENWIENLEFWKDPCVFNQEARCHKGFQDAYLSIKQPLMEQVGKLVLQMKENSTINIYGHSLGGAIATLFAIDLNTEQKQLYQKRFNIITFGSPRVGDQQFAKIFNTMFTKSQVKRYVHRHDPVPHLPTMIINYKHVHGEIWYSQDNGSDQIICDDDLNEDLKCSLSVNMKQFQSIDHLIYFNHRMKDFCNI